MKNIKNEKPSVWFMIKINSIDGTMWFTTPNGM